MVGSADIRVRTLPPRGRGADVTAWDVLPHRVELELGASFSAECFDASLDLSSAVRRVLLLLLQSLGPI